MRSATQTQPTNRSTWTIAATLAVLIAATVVGAVAVADTDHTSAALEDSHSQVVTPADGQPWYQVGAMPLLLMGLAMSGAGLVVTTVARYRRDRVRRRQNER